MELSREMTVGRPLPQILKFTLPLFLGNMLQQVYYVIDAAIVGRFLGVDALAAVGASTSVVFLILGFVNGCCCGFGIPVAQKFGARDYPAMRRMVAVGLRLAAVMSVVLAVVTSLACGNILRWMQTPAAIFDGAYWYLCITFIGIPATFFYNLLASVVRALGDSRTPFLFLLFSAVLNVVLDLVCILVLGWGVAGASIATVVSQLVSAVACYVYMQRHFALLHGTPDDRRFRWREAMTLLGIGVPMGLQFSITAIGSIMLQSANNALGTVSVAAFTAATRIKMFLMIAPFESLGIAMATYCGQNYGAGRPDRIGQGVRAAMGVVLAYTAVMAGVLWLGAGTFNLLFVDASAAEIIRLSTLYLHISCFFFPVLGLLCVFRYSIQGAGFTGLAMFSGVAEMVARILVSLAVVPAFGFLGVCFGDPTAWVFADLFLVPAWIWVYRRLLRRA